MPRTIDTARRNISRNSPLNINTEGLREEQIIIDKLLEAQLAGKELGYWKLFQEIAYLDMENGQRERNATILALFDRLKREGKIRRARRDPNKRVVLLTDSFFNSLTVGTKHERKSIPASSVRYV